MPDKSFRAAIIGTGRIADLYDEELVDYSGLSLPEEVVHTSAYTVDPVSHAASYRSVDGYELIAAANRGTDRLKSFGDRHEVTALYTDYDDLLAAESPDVVSICTPSPAKHDAVIACANAGVEAVIVEKAFGTSLEEARSMIAACERSGTLLAVNHPFRFSPLIRRLREIIKDGVIGDLAHVTTFTGPLVHGGTHDFDLLRYLGGPVDSVDATVPDLEPNNSVADPLTGTYEDFPGRVHVEFESGAAGVVDGTTNGAIGFVLRGTDGYVTAPRLAGVMTLVRQHSESPPDAPASFGWDGDITADEYSGQPIRWAETLPAWPDSETADRLSTTQRLLIELQESMKGDAAFMSNGVDGLGALELAVGAYASELTESPVDLPVDANQLRIRNH